MNSDQLPHGWARASVGDILDAVNGAAFSSKDWKRQGLPIIRIENLKNPRADFNYFDGVPETRNLVYPGDLLFAWSGTPGTSFGAFIWAGPNGVLNQHIWNLRFDQTLIDKRFLRFALNNNLEHYVDQANGGVGLAHITKAKFSVSTIPFPPAREQDRIVAALDERLSELDASVASLERAERNLVRYRAAVLAAACSGKLVPTEADLARRAGRSYEHADQLLARILAERRKANTKAKYEEPAQPDTSKLPKLPEGWVWATVDQLTADQSYGSSAKTGESPDGIPVLRMGNIQDGKLDIAKLKYLPRNHSEFPDLFLLHNDLLFNRTNSAELVGKAAVYQGQPSPCSYASYLIRVRFAPSVFPHYVCGVINSSYGRAWIRSVMHQQVGQANVNGTKLAAFLVPLPPLAEQERIVAEVDRHLSRAEALAASITQSKRRAQRLRRAILAAAFQGRLVPQDPNDEPASVLLDRIRAQTATAEAATASAPRRGRPPAPARAAEPVATYDAPTSKRRGRPPGSKNRSKA